MNNEKKNKHMTLDDRIEIQGCLYRGMSFKAIAKRIGKDPTTVSKEVKSRAKTYYSNFSKTNETCPKLMKAPFVYKIIPTAFIQGKSIRQKQRRKSMRPF